MKKVVYIQLFFWFTLSNYVFAINTPFGGNAQIIWSSVGASTCSPSGASDPSLYPNPTNYPDTSVWNNGMTLPPTGTITLNNIRYTTADGSPFYFQIKCTSPLGTEVYSATTISISNPSPTLTFNSSTINIALGQSVPYSGFATDPSLNNPDISSFHFDWKNPNGSWNFDTANYGGTTDLPAQQDNFIKTGNVAMNPITFTPTLPGVYKVRFSVQDGVGDTNINGGSGRWLSSSEHTLNVYSPAIATISPDPTNPYSKIRWQCENSVTATLTKTKAGVTTGIFTNITIPPSAGSLPFESNTTYTLTCTNPLNADTATYTPPVLGANNVSSSQADLFWDCKNPSARSVTLQRNPGGSITDSSTNKPSHIDTGLSPMTDYVYTLRCFDGLNGLGKLVGFAILPISTTGGGPASSLTLSAYVRTQASQPNTYSSTQPIEQVSTDGSFYDWSYKVATSSGSLIKDCVMDQRNDFQLWYPSPAYKTNPEIYTKPWSTLTLAEQNSFMSSFNSQHDWRLTCTEANGAISRLVWSVKKNNIFPTVMDASCAGTNIKIQCLYSDSYEIKNVDTGAITGSGAISDGSTVSVAVPATTANYSITCKKGGATPLSSVPILRSCPNIMGLNKIDLRGTPLSISKGNQTSLTWDIYAPNPNCKIVASSVKSTPERDAEAVAITALLASPNKTDLNDPYNDPSTGRSRDMSTALQDPYWGVNVLNARGKKTVRLNFTTMFTASCSAGDPLTDPNSAKVKVQVTDEIEG